MRAGTFNSLAHINGFIATDLYSLNFDAFDSGGGVHWWVHFSARMITVGQSRARGGAARQSILLQNFPAITSSLLCRIKACVQLPHHMKHEQFSSMVVCTRVYFVLSADKKWTIDDSMFHSSIVQEGQSSSKSRNEVDSETASLGHSKTFENILGHSCNINVEVLPTIFRGEKYGPRVGIRLDWGRQISAHVFINRAQSSLSFMQLEWGGNSRLAVDSGPFELLFVPEHPHNSKFSDFANKMEEKESQSQERLKEPLLWGRFHF